MICLRCNHYTNADRELAAELAQVTAERDELRRKIEGAFYSLVCTDMNIAICAALDVQDGDVVRILRDDQPSDGG